MAILGKKQEDEMFARMQDADAAAPGKAASAALQARNADYFNPDDAAGVLMDTSPGLTLEEANAQAWKFGRQGLEIA